MIKVEIRYQEELNDRERTFRFDEDVMGGLKMFHKLMDLNCAVVKMELESFGKGVHAGSDKIG